MSCENHILDPCDAKFSLHTNHCTPKMLGPYDYLVKTHDILGSTARIERGKDGFLGERGISKEGKGLQLFKMCFFYLHKRDLERYISEH